MHPKGELAAYCAPYLQRLDYEVIRLDFKNPLKSGRYNFLQPVIDAVNRGDNAKAVDLVWDITSSLVPSDEKVTFYSLASLFVYQHYVALTEAADERGGRLKIRVNFILDEFGNVRPFRFAYSAMRPGRPFVCP